MDKSASKVPIHIGIIPDGNRRWAEVHGLGSLEGHMEGYRKFKSIARMAMDRGVKYLSFYGFSTENWQRSEEEVNGLMSIIKKAISAHEINQLNKDNIRFRFAGSEEGLSEDIVKSFRKAEAKTANNSRGELIICINYGGRREITDAIRQIVKEGMSLDAIDEQAVAKHLYVPDAPDMDLLIRTSGEKRTSNFMPWQAAYAELMFFDKLWPDFNETDLNQALEEYGVKRERRFGV